METPRIALVFLQCFRSLAEELLQICTDCNNQTLMLIEPHQQDSQLWTVTCPEGKKIKRARELHETLVSFRTTSIYIAIAGELPASISSTQYELVNQMANALKSCSNFISKRKIDITLLTENHLPAESLHIYNDVFMSTRTLQSTSANAALRLFLDDYQTKHHPHHSKEQQVIWSGAVSLGHRFLGSSSKQINRKEFPGFVLRISPDATKAQHDHFDSKFRSKLAQRTNFADVIHVSQTFPLLGAFCNPHPGLELFVSAKCTKLAFDLYNSWLETGLSMLLQIGEYRFWCSPSGLNNNSVNSSIFSVMHIADVHPVTSSVLDPCRYRREEVGCIGRSAIRDIPNVVSKLPVVKDVLAVKTTKTEISYDCFTANNSLTFLDASSVLAKRKIECIDPQPRDQNSVVRKRVSAIPPAHLIVNVDTSKAEKYALASMDRNSQGTPSCSLKDLRTPSNLTFSQNKPANSTLARSFDGHHSLSLRTPGTHDVDAIASDISLRQSRFARLHTTRGVNHRIATSGSQYGSGKEQEMHQRTKMSSKNIANRKPRYSNSRKAISVNPFLELEIQRILGELEQGCDFYSYPEKSTENFSPSLPFSWKNVQSNLGRYDLEEGKESEIERNCASLELPCHGIDYTCGDQRQNKRIWQYEKLVCRSKMEFEGLELPSRMQLDKLNNGIQKLTSIHAPSKKGKVANIQKSDTVKSKGKETDAAPSRHRENRKCLLETKQNRSSLAEKTMFALKKGEFDDKEKAELLALLLQGGDVK